jgi:uncharacterized protein
MSASRDHDLADRYGSWQMILGGSEGIGAAFARQAASHGLNVVLAARQPEPLEHDRVAPHP